MTKHVRWEREPSLNVHSRVPSTMRSARRVTDQLELRDWFSIFPSPDATVNICHFGSVLLPLAQLYVWVLHLASTNLRVAFDTLFSLPFPTLLILRMYFIAQHLVLPEHRRNAVAKLVYCAKHWAPMSTSFSSFDLFPEDRFEPSPAATRRLLGAMAASNLPPKQRAWSASYIHRTRFKSLRPITFAKEPTNVSKLAQSWTRSDICAFWSSYSRMKRIVRRSHSSSDSSAVPAQLAATS